MNETSMPTAFPGVPKPPAQQHIKMEPWDSDELYQLTSELICQAEYEIQTDTAGRGEPPSHPNLGCPDIVKQETDEVGCFPDMVKQGPDEALWFPDIVKQGPDEVGRCPDIVNLGPKGAGSCPCIVKVEPGEFGWCPDIVKLGPKGAGSCPCVVKVEPDEVGWCPDIVKVEPEEVGCCPDIVKQEPDERRHGVEECDPLAPGPSRCDTEQGNTRLSHPAMQLSALDKMPLKRRSATSCDEADVLGVVDGNAHLKSVNSGKAPVSTVARRRSVARVRRGKVKDLEESLRLWFMQSRDKNVPLTQSILFKKAKQIALKLKVRADFTVSVEWLCRFVRRYGIELEEADATSKQLQKRLLLTLSDKLSILKVVDDNVHLKKADIAKKLAIPVATLKTIIAKRRKIQEEVKRCGFPCVKVVRVQHRRFPDLEEALWQWFEAGRGANVSLSGSVLIEKAKQIAVKLNVGPAFTASVAWLHRFLRRHGIKLDTVDVDTVAYWKEECLLPLLEVYAARDIFCADEAGLVFALLPRGAAAVRRQRCRDGELGRERLTVLLAANADGSEKLRPLVIGSASVPGGGLPAPYHRDPAAWVTAETFRAWLRELDAGMSSAGRHVVLFLEGSPLHRAADTAGRLRNVHVEFLSANGTSQVQPFRQGIVHDFKVGYRRRVVHQAIWCLDARRVDLMKVTVPQAVKYISTAWDKVTSDTIHNCFKKAWFPEALETTGPLKRYSGIREGDWTRLGGGDIPQHDYMTADDDLATSSPEQDGAEQDGAEQDGAAESEDDEVVLIPNYQEARAAFQTLQAYLYGHDIDDRVQQDVAALCRIIYAMN